MFDSLDENKVKAVGREPRWLDLLEEFNAHFGDVRGGVVGVVKRGQQHF